MNKKETNRLVAILNIVVILSIFIVYLFTDYLIEFMMSGENGGKSIFNSFIIDIVANNIPLIIMIAHSIIGIFNIICAIQNKENKKLCFWQLVFGIYEIFYVSIGLLSSKWSFISWVGIIIVSIVPLLLAIINLIQIKKNKPNIIQILLYVAVIILAILDFFDIVTAHWNIIAVVMQLIYIHRQEKNIIESNFRKITNIILYYGLELIFAIAFLGIIVSSLVIKKVNEIKWKEELFVLLYDQMVTLKDVTNEELLIPVIEENQFGFIDESGKERIACQYDKVSYFNEIEISNTNYYIAFAKKENQFYIISKGNDSIIVSGNLEKYLRTIDEFWGNGLIELFNEKGDYKNAYLSNFQFFFQIFTTPAQINLTQQEAILTNNNNEITLHQRDSKYYYENENYTMLIEPIYDETEIIDREEYDEFYGEELQNTDFLSETTNCKVTITKNNGEEDTSIVSFPGIEQYKDKCIVNIFDNGYIEFKDKENQCNGWYDNNGNKITISENYFINEIKDNKIFLRIENSEDEKDDINAKIEDDFIVIDEEGKILLKTTAIDIYDNWYLVKNSNNKMILMDSELNTISKEYDKIITTRQIDISSDFTSYD